jgi:hypothetical protein
MLADQVEQDGQLGWSELHDLPGHPALMQRDVSGRQRQRPQRSAEHPLDLGTGRSGSEAVTLLGGRVVYLPPAEFSVVGPVFLRTPRHGPLSEAPGLLAVRFWIGHVPHRPGERHSRLSLDPLDGIGQRLLHRSAALGANLGRLRGACQAALLLVATLDLEETSAAFAAGDIVRQDLLRSLPAPVGRCRTFLCCLGITAPQSQWVNGPKRLIRSQVRQRFPRHVVPQSMHGLFG